MKIFLFFQFFLPKMLLFLMLQEFDMLFEEFGRFDGLYLRMQSLGIPSTVHFMWIPLSEMDIQQQFHFITRYTYMCLAEFRKYKPVKIGGEWLMNKIKCTTDDIMVMIVFPLIEILLPKAV